MRVVITGGAGFIGQKLARRLLDQGTLMGPSGAQETIEELVLFDQMAATGFDGPRLKSVVGDIADAEQVAAVIGEHTDSIYHLAAIVSAQAEADFEVGYRINLDGTRNVLEAARKMPGTPRVVFASSIAVYGGAGLAEVVNDVTPLTPQTSYGIAKSAGEGLINDYSRKGFVDGRALRLPTICVRPGKPNRAASTWVSSMIREPLSGVDVVCPVRPDSAMACLSPRRIVDIMVRCHDLPADALGDWRGLLLSGITVTAGEIAEAVERRGNEMKLGAISFVLDPETQAIVDGWPKGSHSDRASALGFEADRSIDEIIDCFIEDDLAAQIASLGEPS